MPNWISVKDRLPEDALAVVAFDRTSDTEYRYLVLWYWNGSWWKDYDKIDETWDVNVTHWMRPEPPEEGGEE